MAEREDEGASPSLAAVRALEQRLADRAEQRELASALVEVAAAEADRIREAGRARGLAAAAEERRFVLAAAEADAVRIRDDAGRRAEALAAALDERLEQTVDVLERLVLPAAEERS